MGAATTKDTRPLLVLVSGAPGAGKSTFAAALAKELRLLHVERDLLMWGLRYTADGDVDREGVGIAAYYRMLAGLLKDGVSVVTDATLYKGKSEPDIREHLLPLARIVNVHCRAKNEHERFYAREVERHGGEPAWLGPHMGHLEKIYGQVVDPLDFGAEQLIEVETTGAYNPSVQTIAAAIGNRNQLMQKENHYGS